MTTDGVVTLRPDGDGFTVEAGGRAVGTGRLRDLGESTAEVSVTLDPAYRGLGYATRAVRLLVEYAFGELGVGRVQARVAPDNAAAVRVARRAGLRNEGVVRVPVEAGEAYLLLGRLRDDPGPTEHGGFRALLNSFLPRKRVIAQALVRDRAGRVLLCHPTYKNDWDLPGGVVEVRESPREAAAREVLEELGLRLPVDRLVLTDWLPPWGGWDDALCLVFDAGTHPDSILDGVVLQAREIRATAFCTVEQVHDRAADFTARRVVAALAAVEADRPAFTESGRTP
ncbi:MAG TPA: GNAT family N-acetyltransferase [Lapillicoccus sp.]|nr:GNAT family N-acetyltransferase [Lapillicoccus sp.]